MKREELIARLSKELHDAKWKYDCHPVRLLLSYDEMDEVISALTALQSEAGRVSVPCKMFAACVLWLEQAAEFGIDAKYGDGTPTPNSQNIAALLSELRTLSAAPAPAAQDAHDDASGTR